MNRYIHINDISDRASKVIILIVDAALNIWFIKIVKQRLLKEHGLRKYAPLVGFNVRLMIVSVSMDVRVIAITRNKYFAHHRYWLMVLHEQAALIGLMSLQNGAVQVYTLSSHNGYCSLGLD